jgi:hypothetical protein
MMDNALAHDNMLGVRGGRGHWMAVRVGVISVVAAVLAAVYAASASGIGRVDASQWTP